MKNRFMIVLLVALPFKVLSQQADTLTLKTDSTGPHAYDTVTRLGFGSYFTLLGSNLKQEFTRPFHMKKKDWGNLGKFALAEGALALFDKPIQKAAAPLKVKQPNVGKVSSVVTKFGKSYEIGTLAALGAYSLIFNNEKMKTTTLLATQGYITGVLLTNVLKYVTGRTRPSAYGANPQTGPRFLGPFPQVADGVGGRDAYASFPSGHSAAAFAVATVFATEYNEKPWVPVILYSSATLVGLSRITENKHWATDVLAGAAIGFLSGKNVVKNYHRYARSKAGSAKKNHPVALSLQYNMGHIQPGLTYKF